MAGLGPGHRTGSIAARRESGGGGADFFGNAVQEKLGEPPFLTRANGGHHAQEFCESFTLCWSASPAAPTEFGTQPMRKPGLRSPWPCERAGPVPVASPNDKKEGHPAERPDTLESSFS
jgi:hypothetical protein